MNAINDIAGHHLEPCGSCSTPTWRYRGSVHDYRCTRCVESAIGLDRPPTDRARRAAHFATTPSADPDPTPITKTEQEIHR